MNHIDEKILELYVLGSEKVTNQRLEIEQHLKECPGCASLYDEMTDYYQEVDTVHRERVEANGEALTLRSMIVRVPPFIDRTPVKGVPATVPARVVLFVVRHYVASSLGFIGMIVAGLLLLLPQAGIKDTNPSYARAKDEFLVAYNKEGEELWRKHIGFGFHQPIGTDPEKYCKTIDVNQDGINEVISIFSLFNTVTNLKNAVVCYNSNGNERWKYEFHRQITHKKELLADDYLFISMVAGDFDRDSKVDVVGIVRHETFDPAIIVRLDANTGAFMSEYFHNGWMKQLEHKDIDRDGIEDLILSGENNGYDMASLLILDPRWIEGYGPMTQEYITPNYQAGKEKYNILFPRTELQEFASQKRNKGSGIFFGDNNLINVYVDEPLTKYGVFTLIYSFNENMKCVKVQMNDPAIAIYNAILSDGKITRKLDDQFFEDLRKSVLYWDGEKLINQPTMNNRYVEALKQQTLP